MAISVDRVYQTVQDLLNVEQRGYLPGRDFNNFADLAQRDLFGKLFSDLAFFKSRSKDHSLADMVQEKIDVFIIRNNADPAIKDDDTGRIILPEDLYSIENIYFTPVRGNRTIVEQVDHSVANYVINSSLTSPTLDYPKYERYESTAKGVGQLQVYPATIETVEVEYIRTPTVPIWGSRSILGNAIYDSTISNDFDLHPSMHDELVDKIMFYSAISIKQVDVAQLFSAEASQDQQIDKTL